MTYKMVSYKIQHTLVYIPYLNALVLPIWIYNVSHTSDSVSHFLKSLKIVFRRAIPLAVLDCILSLALAPYPTLRICEQLIFTYCIPLWIGKGLIHYQTELYNWNK